MPLHNYRMEKRENLHRHTCSSSNVGDIDISTSVVSEDTGPEHIGFTADDGTWITWFNCILSIFSFSGTTSIRSFLFPSNVGSNVGFFKDEVLDEVDEQIDRVDEIDTFPVLSDCISCTRGSDGGERLGIVKVWCCTLELVGDWIDVGNPFGRVPAWPCAACTSGGVVSALFFNSFWTQCAAIFKINI